MKIHELIIYSLSFFVVVACGTTKGASKTDTVDSKPTTTTGGADDDYDGVANSEDACPYIYGTARTNGCPDADGDGLRDSEDVCPDNKGFANLKGCIDRDYDGIIDPEDKCPDAYGENLLGCPDMSEEDADGDGVNNDVDACPDLAGWFTAEGCPDRDGDGIRDDIDACADMFGTSEYSGCPLPKSTVQDLLNQYGNPSKMQGVSEKGYYRGLDGKIYDRDDMVISVVGGDIVGQAGDIMTASANFFVDESGDIRNENGQLVQLDEDKYLFIQGVGVLSNASGQKRPINPLGRKGGSGVKFGQQSGGVTFGSGENQDGTTTPYDGGNPYNRGNGQDVDPSNNNIYHNNPTNYQPLSPAEAADCNRIDLASLRAAIYFDYDASRAESNSLRQLNRVVDAMRKCASLELQVAGHTDADGGDGYNTMLSEKRAKSVLKYIKGQGISDTRLKYNGYGEKYPIAPNSTEEGKQKNRRAEIHVSRAQ